MSNLIAIELHPEICCEQCMNVIHTHIECPNCKDDFAATDYYGDSLNSEDIGFEFKCTECNSTFVKRTENPVLWEQITPK